MFYQPALGFVIIFGLALWLGLYLLHRNGGIPAMRFTGIGLVAYAAGLGVEGTLAWPGGWLLVGVIPALCWLIALCYFWRSRAESPPPRRLFWLVIVASIFLGMSFGSLLLPQDWLLSDAVMLAIGFDLLLLGYGMAALTAFDEGEALLPHALRSLLAAVVVAGLFAGQVVLVTAIEGRSPVLDGLLVSMTAVSIVTVVYAGTLQQWLDDVAFGRDDVRRQQRVAMRAVAEALPRSDATIDLLHMDEAAFTRHTRRALGHLSNLPRLTSNPLMQLPLLDERLQHVEDAGQTLVRAAALKRLLTERIAQLKPPDGNYGVTDAWRFYNALYYPYVVGLKPYSSRTALLHDATDEEKAILAWFRAQVPERTLYNWQNAAAKLVAEDLRRSLQANNIPGNNR